MAQGARPGKDQFAKQHPPRDLAHGLGKIGGTCGFLSDVKPSGFEQKTRLGFLQRAERQNARQKHRGTAQRAAEFVSQRAGGAAGRHIDRGVGDFERAEKSWNSPQ